MTSLGTTGSYNDDEHVVGIAALHTRLRRLILDGTYPPGMLIPQEELARTLGVSRTPLREVLRLLQKEGLVEAGRYQRCRVAPFEPEMLDTLYAGRIQLETLGIALTVPRMQQEDLDALSLTLDEMRAATDSDTWEIPHRRFHYLLTRQAGSQICTTITNYADQSHRYRLLFGQNEIHARSLTMVEHTLIMEACVEHNREEAVQRMARHLARTALTVLAHMAPEYEPVAVRTALLFARLTANPPEETTGAKKRVKGASQQ